MLLAWPSGALGLIDYYKLNIYIYMAGFLLYDFPHVYINIYIYTIYLYIYIYIYVYVLILYVAAGDLLLAACCLLLAVCSLGVAARGIYFAHLYMKGKDTQGTRRLGGRTPDTAGLAHGGLGPHRYIYIYTRILGRPKAGHENKRKTVI